MTPRTLRQILGIGAALLFAAGCYGGAAHPLLGRGPLPLSATNPFLGANQFIGEQLSRGRSLRELFLHRGGADAIELTSADSFQLIYLRHRQTYFADRIESGSEGGDWVVRGPYTLSRRQFLTVTKLGIYPGASPVFIVNGRLTNFRLPPTPTPSPTPSIRSHTPRRSPARRRHSQRLRKSAVLRPSENRTTGTSAVLGAAGGAVERAVIQGTPTPNSDQRALSATRPTPYPIEMLKDIIQQGFTPIPLETARKPVSPTPEASSKPSKPTATEVPAH